MKSIEWSTISLQDLAGAVSSTLHSHGLEAILVGGACVTIYAPNRYQSYDLDFVTYADIKSVEKALAELGFSPKNRYFQRPDCPWLVEFVTAPVAVGKETIARFNRIRTPLGTIQLLRPEDSVKDRLASYFHWNDRQALQQAIDICQQCKNLDLGEVRAWAHQEGFEVKHLHFEQRLKISQSTG